MHTNFHVDWLSGVEVDALPRHLVVSYDKLDTVRTFSVKKHFDVPTFMVIGQMISEFTRLKHIYQHSLHCSAI